MVVFTFYFLQVFFTLLLSYALMGKLLAPRRLVHIIEGYDLLPVWTPKQVIFLAATLIICAEATGIWLLVAQTQQAGLFVGGLLAFYTLAIGVNFSKGNFNFDCGCSLPSSSLHNTHLSSFYKTAWLLVRNCLLVTAALGLFSIHGNYIIQSSLSIAQPIAQPIAYLALPAIAAAFFFTLYLFLDELVGLFAFPKGHVSVLNESGHG